MATCKYIPPLEDHITLKFGNYWRREKLVKLVFTDSYRPHADERFLKRNGVGGMGLEKDWRSG